MLSPDLNFDLKPESRPRDFAASALPLTIELARVARSELASLLPEATQPFCFEDRVFLLLVPEMQRDVVKYYARCAGNLTVQLQEHQLESLDKKLLHQLFALLERHHPVVAQALRAAAERPVAPARTARRSRNVRR